MLDLADIHRQLSIDAEAIRALTYTVSPEQAQWKPKPRSWSMQQVMEHVYNEERIDFRKHLKEMLNNPPQGWGASAREEYIRVSSISQALQGFLTERATSLAWIKGLQSPDWDYATQVSFGPSHKQIALSAGDVLVSWIEHDFLHIRQINELLHAWNIKQVSPYSVAYGGSW